MEYLSYAINAKGAFLSQPGAAPQGSIAQKNAGAESAIHFRPILFHLDSDVRPQMHAYLATLCRDLAAEVVRVGGVADHVHIVTTLPRTLSRARLIEQTTFLKSLPSAPCPASGERIEVRASALFGRRVDG